MQSKHNFFMLNYCLLLFNCFEIRLCNKNLSTETLKVAHKIFQNGVSAVVAKRRRLIFAIYFLPTAGDIKRYHCLRTVI